MAAWFLVRVTQNRPLEPHEAGWIRIHHYVQQFQSIGTSCSDSILGAVAEYHSDANAVNLN